MQSQSSINLKIDSSKPVLLIDGGYLLFYRWHATDRWISFQKDLEVTDEKRIELFKAHLESQLTKLIKSMKLQKVSSNVIFCIDCKSRNVWRRNFASENGIDYKGTRASSTISPELYSVYIDVLKSFGSLVSINELEADDIAALLIQRIPVSVNIKVITSDHDYLQLKRDGLEIVNATGKKVEGLSEDPEVNLWAKIFMGDPSDNIQAAVPKCGKKTALKLASDPLFRQQTIDKYKERVEINRTLVDFTRIPQRLIDEFDSCVRCEMF